MTASCSRLGKSLQGIGVSCRFRRQLRRARIVWASPGIRWARQAKTWEFADGLTAVLQAPGPVSSPRASRDDRVGKKRVLKEGACGAAVTALLAPRVGMFAYVYLGWPKPGLAPRQAGGRAGLAAPVHTPGLPVGLAAI